MKKELSPPVAIAGVVLAILVITGLYLMMNRTEEGKKPGPGAGGIRTSSGKIIPTVAGGGPSNASAGQ